MTDRHSTLEYVEGMLRELCRMSANPDMELLRFLMEMASLEASRLRDEQPEPERVVKKRSAVRRPIPA